MPDYARAARYTAETIRNPVCIEAREALDKLSRDGADHSTLNTSAIAWSTKLTAAYWAKRTVYDLSVYPFTVVKQILREREFAESRVRS